MIRNRCLAVLIIMIFVSGTTAADAASCDSGSDCCATCPACKACCKLKVEDDKEKKSCYKVECEEICIPRVVFPWQKKHSCDPCLNNGAKVKTVRKLKKHSYECPTCKYTWTPVKADCCGDGCCNAGACDSGSVIYKDSAAEPTQPVAAPLEFLESAKRSSLTRLVLPVRFLRAAQEKD